MLLTDYHSHTALSPDGKVSLAEMAAAARAAGLAELCVTDHCDLLDENGRIKPGDKVVLVAFGGGFTSGAVVYEA